MYEFVDKLMVSAVVANLERRYNVQPTWFSPKLLDAIKSDERLLSRMLQNELFEQSLITFGAEPVVIVDGGMLMQFFRISNFSQLQEEYYHYIQTELEKGTWDRYPGWRNSITVGTEKCVNELEDKLGINKVRSITNNNGDNWNLHEPGISYS